MVAPASARDPAPRCLGALQGAAVVAGNMIGVGIFLLPAQVASHAPTTGWFLLAWALGGLWALCGALCLGELGAMLPQAGGDYAFLREVYGRDLACSYGWLSLLVTFPGSLAVMASLTARYQAPTVLGPWLSTELVRVGDWTLQASQLAAMATLIALTLLNHRSTRGSGWSQVAVTAVPLAMLLLGAAGLVSLVRAPGLAVATTPVVPPARELALGLALLPVYFAYAGWNAAAYVGGEVREPARNLPRSLLAGTGAVTVLYLLVSVAYTRAVPVEAMPGVPSVGAAAATALFGTTAGLVVDALIVVAVLGSLNATVLTGSRVIYALADDGLFPRWAAVLHPRWRTPGRSLWLLCALACGAVLVGDVEPVLDVTVSAMVLMSLFSVGALLVLRWRRPDVARPYRTPLVPLVPLVYLAIGGLVLWASLRAAPARGGGGLLLAALVWGLHRLLTRRRRCAHPPEKASTRAKTL